MTVQDAVSTAGTSTRRKRGGTPELYDFRRPMTLAREHGRVLEMAFETFARHFGTLLTSRLRVVAQVTVESVELRTYDEYVRSLPGTTAMVLCAVEPGRSTAVWQLPMDTTMVWVDYLLGGPGVAFGPEDHELTEIEWQLVRDLLQQGLHDLGYAFASVTPVDLAIRSVQYNPQFVQAAAASEPVIVTTFELTINDRPTMTTLMVPADVLLASLRAGELADGRSVDELRAHQRALDAVAERVRDVPVGVAVRFRPLAITPREISGLAVGDVVGLRHRADLPLDVVVDDVVLARAALGSNGTRLACLVVTSEEKH